MGHTKNGERNMRYYDDTIRTIDISFVTGIGQWKSENFRTIEITKETNKFMYGIAWDGRYKYDKKNDTWYRYEYYVWRELRVVGKGERL